MAKTTIKWFISISFWNILKLALVLLFVPFAAVYIVYDWLDDKMYDFRRYLIRKYRP